jgi:hypothetical protein
LWGKEALKRAAQTDRPWLWHGLLAPGAVTLLTSLWKSGKTTLASVLLAKLGSGGQLAGRALAPGRAVVITEETPAQWCRRAGSLDFGDHVGCFCRPFKGKPRPADWVALLDRVAELHVRRRLALLLVDPLAPFLPGHSENDACTMLDALLPLQRLTSLGLSVLLSHHPAKGKLRTGQAARGSGALPAHVDILLEMRRYSRARSDRRRRLEGFSRYPETPEQLVIEWTADGSDYVAHGSFADMAFADCWLALQMILADAPRKLSRGEIRQRWPGGHPPTGETIRHHLEQAVAQGLARQDGLGVRGQPFRYWLPAREDQWRQDPEAYLKMPELFLPPS